MPRRREAIAATEITDSLDGGSQIQKRICVATTHFHGMLPTVPLPLGRRLVPLGR